jgi:two-component system NtrC family sensor kinase
MVANSKGSSIRKPATVAELEAELEGRAAELKRLTAERDEALEQQTATAEILRVINASPGNLRPVFDAMLETVLRLCAAAFGVMGTYDGERFRSVSERGVTEAYAEFRKADSGHYAPGTGPARLLEGESVVHVPDLLTSEPYQRGDSNRRALVDLGGARASLMVPLLKDAALIGYIMIYRKEPGAFTDQQIALLQNFAAQAVIAMENARLITETQEALDQQTATAEVLQVINSSPGDLAPVFNAMLEKAMRLCEGAFGYLMTFDGERFQPVAHHGLPARLAEYLPRMDQPGPRGGYAHILGGAPLVHIADLMDGDVYQIYPMCRALVDLGGARTGIIVALRKDESLLGVITIYRQEVRPFADKQIAVLQNFAAQAVIAMENARLITETKEALEQQTATAEVLGVINSSPGDLAPVFEAIVERAHTLCDASHGSLQLWDGEKFRGVAMRGFSEAMVEGLRRGYSPVGMPCQRVVEGDSVAHCTDLAEVDHPTAQQGGVALAGIRTILYVALRKDEVLLGQIVAARQEVRPFSERELALVESFAAQAVIAMENARLITDTREALDQQTATAEVLGVINSSPGDLAPVFDAMLEKAASLCEADIGILFTHDSGSFTAVAWYGTPEPFREFLTREPLRPSPDTGLGSMVLERRLIHLTDVFERDSYRRRDPLSVASVELGKTRTFAAVPLVKDETLVGAFVVYRQEVRPFSDKQIALLENFAAQAVIAMENARLITETRERSAELQEALEYQTATSDVLNFISRSTFDLTPVLEYVIETAIRLCRAHMGSVFRLEDGVYRWAAGRGLEPEYREIEMRTPISPGSGTLVGRVALEGRTVQIADAEADPLYAVKDEARITRARTMLGVPLLRDGAPIGVIAMARDRVELFNDKEIALVTTFADQAVIAIENVRLITETREARDDAEAALSDLKAAQANLIQAEKMASLGQLTAGIAHEIKNPLNFVNNFASLSVELLDELKETAETAIASLDEKKREEVGETIEMLTGNLEKIAEHGKRADNIVKSMLEHSRGVSGERRKVDLNGLVEEALNLAYHGARAQDQGFNITLERDFASALKPIELAPQEMTRVFLNLFGNGFYAANKRVKETGNGSFRPILRVATHDLGDAVEVRVRDNGTGIPPEIKDKLFQPFFTTKPTGEGTGLGLSISYDIVTQQHGGTITVDSEVGAFTEFTIRLPRY